jgi:hypothetical protein
MCRSRCTTAWIRVAWGRSRHTRMPTWIRFQGLNPWFTWAFMSAQH